MALAFRNPYTRKPRVNRDVYDAAANRPKFKDGFIAVDAFFGTAPTGRLKRWSGTAWVVKNIKHWNGTVWELKPLRAWNGAAWI